MTGRHRKPNRARSALVRSIIDMIDRSGHTDREVAERAGIGYSHLSRIRAGEFDEPRLSTLLALAGAFGMGLELLPDPDAPKPWLTCREPYAGSEQGDMP